jgi:exonuclease III
MKIMGLNAWGGKLYEQLSVYLSDDPPDILCLQEVIHTPETEAEWLTYRDGDHILPQRANLFRDLCRALKDHVGTFCPAAQGELWDSTQSIPSQWGLATFVRKSIPVIGQVQGFIHKDYSPDGYGDHPRSRNAHGVRLYDHDGNRTVCVTQMHGLRDLKGKIDTPERAAQAQRLLELSRQVSAPSELGVICGDFNVEPNSQTLRILADAGWHELVTAGDFEGTRTSHYAKSGKFADYMLISDAAKVKNFRIIREPQISDHCPLILEI